MLAADLVGAGGRGTGCGLREDDGMSADAPKPILPAEVRRRRVLALRLARSLGFVGRVEYRHVYAPAL